MFPADRVRRRLVAVVLAAFVAALLPATALAVGPVAADDHTSVPVDAAATTIDVLAGDTGGPLTIQSATDPAHGTVVVAANGLTLTYQPDAAFHATDTFDYTITDGEATDGGTVIVDVNSPPVAVDDPGAACANPVSFGGAFPFVEDWVSPNPPPNDYFLLFGTCRLLHNDTDPDGDPLTWMIDTQPAHGHVVKVQGEEFFGYKADPDSSATDEGLPATDFDSFTYRAFDGFAYSQPATMRFWVAPINDAPRFTPGVPLVVVGEDGGAYSAPWATSISPGPPSESWQAVHFETDVDPNGVPNLFAVAPSVVASGVSGVLTFTPAPDEVGLVHVTVRAKDDGGLEDWQAGSSTPPDDTSDDVTFDIVVMPDDVTAVDDQGTVLEDPSTPVTLNVLGNDTFEPGARITEVTQGTLGLVTIAPDGLSVRYTPDPDENGHDSFSYTLDDDAGSADTATVDVTITPDNDAPVAGDDTVTVRTNGPAKAVDVLADDTDVDGDALSITAAEDSGKGIVVITGGGTGLTYQPNPDATGSDSFTYTVGDGHGASDFGTVTVTIADNTLPVANDDPATIVEDAAATPIDVVANDTDGDLDTLLITGTTPAGKGTVVVTGGGTGLTFEPHPDATGADTFTYTVSDGHGGTDSATVPVTITPTNDAPEATADGLTVTEDAAATAVDVLSNDSDPDDDDTQTITGVTQGAKGVVAITGLGTGLTYKPNAEAFGVDSFTYTIGDGNGGSATATVLVGITPVNDKPNALNDTTFSVPESAGATVLPVLTNDLELDGDALTITAKTNGAHGSVAITGNGTGLTYNPNQLYFGSDVFTYTVSDGHGSSDTATVLLMVVKDTVKPVATAPVESFINQTTGTGTVKVRITWGGSDAGGTGIGKYQLQVSVNGGSFLTIGLASPTATSIDRTQSMSATYRYRVRATDRQGNVGAYATGPTFSVARFQDTSASVHYSRTWKPTANTNALGDSHRYTTLAGATASYTGTMRDVAFVATRTATSGSAQVWIDGTLAATLNLRASSTGYRKIVFHRHFASLATHTIQIRSLGGGRVYFDAFLVDR